MLSIKRVKELINDQGISDEEAEKIRDGCRALTEVIFEQWQMEIKTKAENKYEYDSKQSNTQ